MGPEVVLSRRRFLLICCVHSRCSVGRPHIGLPSEPAVWVTYSSVLCWGWHWHRGSDLSIVGVGVGGFLERGSPAG